MTTFLNLVATEPEIAKVPIMIDSSKWSILQGGTPLRARQGGRQLDQPEGRRGRLPREGRDDPALRRGGGRDVLRRGRAGRHRRAEAGDRRAFVPPAGRPRRVRSLRRDRRPEHPRGRNWHRGAQRVREGVHRGHPRDQATLSGRQGLGRCVQSELLVPRERDRAPRDALGVPVPRDRGRARHGDRQRRATRRLPGHPRRPAGTRGRCDLQPACRRDGAPRDVRGRAQGRGHTHTRGGPHLARSARGGAPVPRPRARHRPVDRRGHRRGAG